MSFDKNFAHHEALFQAALGEFAAAGYDQASINAILEKAGMSKGQFYYHFKNKQSLYFALIEVLIQRKKAYLAAALRPEDFEQDLFTILRTHICIGAAFARENPDIQAFSESFLREKGSPIYPAVLKRYNLNNDAGLRHLVEQAYRRGELRTDLPLPFLQQLISFLFTHAAEITDLSSPEESETQLDHLIRFIRSGAAR